MTLCLITPEKEFIRSDEHSNLCTEMKALTSNSIDALIGHAEGDASKKAYAGVGVPRRHELLSRLRHPWLNTSPKG